MDIKNILISVDASDNAMRAVDYAASILANAEGVRVTLLYIERAPNRDKFDDEAAWLNQCKLDHDRVFDFLKTARQKLVAAGLPEASVHERTVLCSAEPSIAQTILDVQQAEGFGTLVVGRRGLTKGEEFLFGSVSSKLVHNAKNCAVWVVQ
ncbi:MAG: universal stress protein [Humidesulfovibrio sp.]|uniref:universal stress protein n=1 Tax=Humidesulfovibrio sp. TaxID=2910988 RepID=UPI0027E84FC0|nr:universal stress protein [Humidesulfovibrio sp.]MDQ7833912.1 universal stress protein [Humidesulfovibrio sp.]